MSLTNRTKLLGLLLFSSFMLNFIPNFNKGVENIFESLDYLDFAKDRKAVIIALDNKEFFFNSGYYIFRESLKIKREEERFLKKSDEYEEEAKKDFAKSLIYGRYFSK